MSKLSDQWQTPDWLFDELNKEFNFDIDLCATKENSKCERYCIDYLTGKVGYTFDDTVIGKKIRWELVECAFMNPPYSNPKQFIEKAWEDSKYCKIVCLVKCDTSTRWWATFWNYDMTCSPVSEVLHKTFPLEGNVGPKPGCEVRFFPKRINFQHPQLNSKNGATFPCALVIMDRRCAQ